ncbi:protein FAR1-RELATED SEQUENCE 5-like [Rhododendron vialii]|uniref:protein FAR1-RELATED SEQUENCE 5-like n=1 Tax=Rhododendron vialii TaxID=182163 RepID=UPI00265E5319|nr:protein FAR1-RELATED SEQUENCE 5-like [Rhododendron vialii]
MDQFDGSQGGHANVQNDKVNSSSYSKKDILEQKFDSEEDAHAFYNACAKEMGFSIWKDRLKVNEANVSQKYCVPFLLSHRHVSDAVRAQTKAMHNVSVKTGQIMDLKVNESGGYGDVGFTLKDLQNKIEVERQVELKDGDAEDALGYLSARADADPLFFFKYTVDEDNRLGKLFWVDSKSRMDHAAFGDVLIFNTTYRTNAYKKPFVILAGMSNHFLTTIFGCAWLVDETFATYTWVLKTLREAMDNK